MLEDLLEIVKDIIVGGRGIAHYEVLRLHLGNAQKGSISAITFNFGWLPGGDHNVFTKPETSIQAIEAGLSLLKDGGIMTLILYYGRETGFAERDALLDYLPTLDSDLYTVIEMPFVNRPNCPPIPIVILKG